MIRTVPSTERTVAALLFGAALATLSACTTVRNVETSTVVRTDPSPSTERTNILLVVFEDLSPRWGAFGDLVAKTPVLDAFAQEAIAFDAVFTTAGVCAPSRSSLITGHYQQAIGTQYMRTGSGGPIPYEAVPPADVKAFPELLRSQGYYTTNSGSFGTGSAKTDYQFGEPFTIWDEQSADHPWDGRAQGQPFFAMVNVLGTHESQTWPLDAEPLHPFVPTLLKALERGREGREEIISPDDVEVPPFLPDTQIVRQDIAQHYENIFYEEKFVASLLEELEEDGLDDSTIVIVTTDHGDGFPRMKRSLYDGGLHVPMLVRFPDRQGAGTRRDELVSFIDMAPTLLSLANADLPDGLPGRIFLGDGKEAAPDYIFAAMDRHDEVPDRQRAIRDDRWKYIRNYQTDHSFFRHLRFRDVQPAMQELWRLHEADELLPIQEQYFDAPRPEEELYDTVADPYEVNNLAGEPGYVEVLQRMRAAFDVRMAEIGDLSSLPETEMIEQMWPGMEQPMTAAPEFSGKASALTIASDTEGASIGYRTQGDQSWSIYTGPIIGLAQGAVIEAKAIRYGFQESDISHHVVE